MQSKACFLRVPSNSALSIRYAIQSNTQFNQICNSIKYAGSRHQKEFIKDLRTVYGAVSKDAAEANLDTLAGKWEEMYPIVIKSWRDNWERLTEYFQYTPAIRKLIYTTNTVEGYHRQVRKVTKTKGVFPTDTSLEKLVYLAYRNICKKWTMPISNWGKSHNNWQ